MTSAEEEAYLGGLLKELACRGVVEAELVRDLSCERPAQRCFEGSDLVPEGPRCRLNLKRLRVGALQWPVAVVAKHSGWAARCPFDGPITAATGDAPIKQRPAVPRTEARGGHDPICPDVSCTVCRKIFGETPATPGLAQSWLRSTPPDEIVGWEVVPGDERITDLLVAKTERKMVNLVGRYVVAHGERMDHCLLRLDVRMAPMAFGIPMRPKIEL